MDEKERAEQLDKVLDELAQLKTERVVNEAFGADLPPKNRLKYLMMEAEKRFEWSHERGRLEEKGAPIPADLNAFRHDILRNPIFRPSDSEGNGEKDMPKRISADEFRFKAAGKPGLMDAIARGEVVVDDD